MSNSRTSGFINKKLYPYDYGYDSQHKRFKRPISHQAASRNRYNLGGKISKDSARNMPQIGQAMNNSMELDQEQSADGTNRSQSDTRRGRSRSSYSSRRRIADIQKNQGAEPRKQITYVSEDEEKSARARHRDSSDVLNDSSEGDEADGDAAADNPEPRDVLTRQQINQAIMDIEDMHPLVQITHYDHIVPCCKFFQRVKCMKRKPNFKHALR
jgi:hypothetical protein|tara:strand:- start:3369 stop:4007 length:639 start_codon:yes stop_codon:yes gene_type:complete